MSDEQNNDIQNTPEITSRQRKFVVLWAVTLIVLLAASGIFLINSEYQNKNASIVRHHERIDSNVIESGHTAADSDLPADANPIKVLAGVYVDRIVEFDIKTAGWTVDCYVWFKWNGNAVNSIENFRIIDGDVLSKEKEDEYTIGNEHYVRYRIIARITKFFDISRFPCDDHQLIIGLEIPSFPRYAMLFVPDKEASNISSRVKLPGYKIFQMAVVEKPHSYKSNRGDPRIPNGIKSTYSQFRMGIWIQRADWGFFFKMFVTLYIAVALALLMYIISPDNIDARLAMGLTAIFAAIGNMYITSSLLPDTGDMALADIINGISFMLMFITVLESSIAWYVYEKMENKGLAKLYDKVTLIILSTGYILINVALPLAASL